MLKTDIPAGYTNNLFIKLPQSGKAEKRLLPNDILTV